MKKWLIKKCKESETFAFCVMLIGIALMVLIALI